MKQIIYSDGAPAPIGPYSQAVLLGETLYCSGQVPLDAASGEMVGDEIKSQTEKVCANIRGVLAAAGMTFEDVVKTTCYLADMGDFAEFNAVYGKYFVSNPARSTVAVKALPKGALVEVEVLAAK